MGVERQELRQILSDPGEGDAGLNPAVALVSKALPVLSVLAVEDRDVYLRLRVRYEEEGPSRELADDAIAAANDLGAVLQALRRIQVHLEAMAQSPKLSALAPPLMLFDQLHNSLFLLTGDDPDTLELAITPEELQELFVTKAVAAWFATVERWVQTRAV